MSPLHRPDSRSLSACRHPSASTILLRRSPAAAAADCRGALHKRSLQMLHCQQMRTVMQRGSSSGGSRCRGAAARKAVRARSAAACAAALCGGIPEPCCICDPLPVSPGCRLSARQVEVLLPTPRPLVLLLPLLTAAPPLDRSPVFAAFAACQLLAALQGGTAAARSSASCVATATCPSSSERGVKPLQRRSPGCKTPPDLLA